MNERIRELAEQAGASRRAGVGGLVFRDSELEKFAELIVKECSAKAWWAEQYDMGNGVPISKQIKEHFGVE